MVNLQRSEPGTDKLVFWCLLWARFFGRLADWYSKIVHFLSSYLVIDIVVKYWATWGTYIYITWRQTIRTRTSQHSIIIQQNILVQSWPASQTLTKPWTNTLFFSEKTYSTLPRPGNPGKYQSSTRVNTSSAVLSQMAVTAYLRSEQLLPFGFADQISILLSALSLPFTTHFDLQYRLNPLRISTLTTLNYF